MPPIHNDALGYVRDLATEENSEWFRYLCDVAIERTNRDLTLDDKATLQSLLLKRASHLPRRAVALPTGMGAASTDFLEEVKDFSAFKRLGPSLNLIFPKRITIVFGTNGSGKSSICEALRALSDATRPVRPLHNVTQSPPGTPSFSYRFRNNGGPIVWNQAAGYGSCAETILVWTERRGSNDDRIHLYLPEERYLVVLADRGKYILPWTAFYIERDNAHRKYLKRYERNIGKC